MLYDPDRRWVDRAVCRKLDSKLFFAAGGQPDRTPHKKTQALWDEAKEVCSYCPVFTECRRDTAGEEYGVWGGLDEHQRYLARRAMSKHKRWKKWPAEKQLAWGEHLAQLRTRGLKYAEIQRLTGLAKMVVDDLIKEWKATLPKVEVVPEPASRKALKPDFPTAKGSKHGWVRNGAIVADGWYAGHTADGEWVRMQIYSGRGHVFKFFRPENVKFYHPQPRWIVSYKGRPDADAVREEAHAAA